MNAKSDAVSRRCHLKSSARLRARVAVPPTKRERPTSGRLTKREIAGRKGGQVSRGGRGRLVEPESTAPAPDVMPLPSGPDFDGQS